MNSHGKDHENNPDEESFFADDYDEESFDYDPEADQLAKEDIFEPDLTKNWDKTSPDDKSPFDDELEFDEEEFELEDDVEYELEEESAFDDTLEPNTEPLETFDEEEQWQDDELDSQDDGYIQPWPLGLFAAAIIALLLLAAGGYGVLEQRLDLQKEVRLLRAKLATTTSNTEVAESRQAQRNLQIYNGELQTQVKRLTAENTVLHEELAQQEKQASGQHTRAATPAPASAPTIVEPIATKITTPVVAQKASTKVAPPKPIATQNMWFVNFGSYKIKATADSWASRLSVDAGRVAIVLGEKKGTLYYRVRVIDLPNKEIAGKIAHQLERTHHLSHLWVGKQQ